MAKVNKADFYFGSVLSVMLSNGVKPALFEETSKGRIYTFSTNNGDYQIYMKYLSAPKRRKNQDIQSWQFFFYEDEMNIIKSCENNEKINLIGLICGKEKLKESEIVILNFEEAKSCLGFEFEVDPHRITVRYEKSVHGLKVYGTARDVDNTINVSRDIISGL